MKSMCLQHISEARALEPLIEARHNEIQEKEGHENFGFSVQIHPNSAPLAVHAWHDPTGNLLEHYPKKYCNIP